MADTWFKIKVWTKLILIGLVALFVGLFVLENYSITTSVWLFGTHTMTVLELLMFTFLCGVIVTLVAKPIYRTLGQIAELRKKDEPPAKSAMEPAPVVYPPPSEPPPQVMPLPDTAPKP
jgi:H+/Cl- antiporter ClcA